LTCKSRVLSKEQGRVCNSPCALLRQTALHEYLKIATREQISRNPGGVGGRHVVRFVALQILLSRITRTAYAGFIGFGNSRPVKVAVANTSRNLDPLGSPLFSAWKGQFATRKGAAMNVIVVASRKGGTGKSTLIAHLAAHNHNASRSCLLIDADPQGSLTLWHRLRKTGEPPLRNGLHGFSQTIESARHEGFEWVLIDTPPLISTEVSEMIRTATLVVIPARPAVFDLNAIMETIAMARLARTPFAVVFNAVPPKRLGNEPPMMVQARRSLADLEVPVWSGQITQRANLGVTIAEGAGVDEYNNIDSRTAADEIVGLWAAIENSVMAIHGAHSRVAVHQRAA